VTSCLSCCSCLFGCLVVCLLLDIVLSVIVTQGLGALSKGVPWNLQGALYTVAFYHFMVFDKLGCIGQTLRALFGEQSPQSVVCIIAIVQIIQLELHVLCSPEANLFAPFHALLYAIFRVNGPKQVVPSTETSASQSVGWPLEVRKRAETILDLTRFLLVLAVVVHHLVCVVLPSSLQTVDRHQFALGDHDHEVVVLQGDQYDRWLMRSQTHLSLNAAVGSCQWMHAWRACEPVATRFEVASCVDKDSGSDHDQWVCGSVAAGDSPSSRYYRLATYRAAVTKGDSLSLAHALPVQVTPLLAVPLDDNNPPVLSFANDGHVLLHRRLRPESGSGSGSSPLIKVEYWSLPFAASNGLEYVDVSTLMGGGVGVEVGASDGDKFSSEL
jgi:hypothetical protein